MRVTVWIVDLESREVLATFEKISVGRARRIARSWRKKQVGKTTVIFFSDSGVPCFLPP